MAKWLRAQWRPVILAAILLLLSLITLSATNRYANTHKTMVDPIGFHGEYTAASGDARIPPGGKLISTLDSPEITLRGTFDRPLIKGDQIFFLIEYLEVRIWLDGKEIYSFGTPGRRPSTMHSSGMSWSHIVVPVNTDETNEWTITLKNPYRNNYYSAYQDFYDSLQIGDSGALARKVLAQNFAQVLAGVVFFFLSLLALLVTGVLSLQGIRLHRSVHLFGAGALVVSFCILLNPLSSTLVLANPARIMQLEPLCLMLASIVLTAYFGSFLTTGARKVSDALLPVMWAAVVFYLVTQCLGLSEPYAMRTALVIGMAAVTLANAGMICYEIRHSTVREYRAPMVLGLLFLCTMMVEEANYAIEFWRQGWATFFGFLVLILAQCALAVRYIRRAVLLTRQTAALERELTESRIAVMLSQIQPHFLYNTLDGIGELCATDPERAEWAVTKFSMYLRGNLDALGTSGSISFDRELAHTRHYLELEQMRFDERLRVEYDVRATAFRLPPLTLQPIAENAVRYGATRREDGGFVRIETGETESHFFIKVSDNGPGFGVETPSTPGRTHIGLQNVRSRLFAACGGELIIDSTPENGTTVHILIPKEQEA